MEPLTFDKRLENVRAKSDAMALFPRTMLVLTIMTATAAFGSYVSFDLVFSSWTQPVGLVIGLFVILAWANYHSKNDQLFAVVPGMLFAFVLGLMIGPALAMYFERLGAQVMADAFLMTIGLTAVFGFIGSFVSLPYRKIEGILMAALFGLIIVAVVTIFTGMPSHEFNTIYSIVGLVIFIGFFMVDFWRLKQMAKHGMNGWGNATMMALDIFLDMANVFLFILALGDD
ncbi:TPA: hypothetical protein DF272_03485 [Candidatus Falkowbacteria bacterium]|nr:hypothetical protein [Candidatus Falkowbacteria bacterium]